MGARSLPGVFVGAGRETKLLIHITDIDRLTVMCPFKQQEHRLGLETPLGPDALLLARLSGTEEMSRLFHFKLDLLSEDDGLPAPGIVGKNVTFRADYPDGSPRFFNGFVNRFTYCGRGDRLSVYRAEVVPWLWFLTRTTDCRIFQGKKAPDIVKQIFSDLGFTHFKFDLQGNHPTWDYCVQYRESDFQFVSRLLEEEGIFYYFQHENGKHTLMLGDHKDAFKDAKDKDVEFRAKLSEGNVTDHIWNWEHQYEFRTGKWAQTDYNFETPTTSLMANASSVVKLDGNSKFEQYEYPGGYEVRADGDANVKVRMEEEEVAFDTVRGAGQCRSFSPGGKFKLVGHHSSREQGKGYVLTRVVHTAQSEASYANEASAEVEPYHNEFECIPDSVVFRPERRTTKPLIQSVQTAVVTGPAGEEIFTDKYGRVKVQFYWDREGKQDDKTTCWMRVSQVHAGKSFGGIDIPRIGEEVIVSFIDGDPDRPLITGRVYNAGNMPPYGLDGPDNAKNKVISGMKSKTYKGSGYNEFIMDDTPGKELIRVHGQYDMDTTIEHDLREKVRHNRTRSVSVNETISIGVNRTETVGKNESLTVGENREQTIGMNDTLTVGLIRTHVVGVNDSITVGAAQEITVGGVRTVTVGGAMNYAVGGAMAIAVGGAVEEAIGGKYELAAGDDMTASIKKKLKIDAGDEIEIVTGAASIVMKKDGKIEISGTDVTMKAGAGKVNIDASGIITIKGPMVKINT
ncbi:MAG: type VI secretion system tip protein TssI/VgrG [Planctomycetia bacterium]|nr:type VI secretion system tip protein TssI/VgrG [Planctomycetia bacterium]